MTTPPPNPGRRDPEGRRRAIVRATAELIVENGPAGISHRAIAKRAEVSLGSTTQYFASLDELREQALQMLSDDTDEQLAEVEAVLSELPTSASPQPAAATPAGLTDDVLDRIIAFMHVFLLDARAVSAELALLSSATVDPRMRAIAQRWNNRLTDLLTPHVGPACAAAITVYTDGATVHAGLHDEPLTRAELTAAVKALLTMCTPERTS